MLSASGSTCSGDTTALRSEVPPRSPSMSDSRKRRSSVFTAEKCARRSVAVIEQHVRELCFVEIGVGHRAGVEHDAFETRHAEITAVELAFGEPNVAQPRL